MSRAVKRIAALLAAVVALPLPAVVSTGTAGAVGVTADPTPVRTLAVSGTGVGSYPAFDPAIARYGITTTADTAGTVVVAASTSDPAGSVYVNGRKLTGASTTVTGLTEGAEIAVFFVDAAGTARHSLVYLPAQFPALERIDITPSTALATGDVLLTLGKWLTPGPFFEAAVDRNGVPSYVKTTTQSLDLKAQPGGGWTVSRTTNGEGRTGTDVVELDSQFREVNRYRTVGLVDTDSHDSLLMPDGSRYLMAYEPNAVSGLIDSVVQHISSDGDVLFEWNSADHVNPAIESVAANTQFPTDYAHINSFDVMADGDLLMSFRHLSSVFKVARTAHDGFSVGDVVWRLGGKLSDFTFTDLAGDPDGGPCAQHTADELPNGNILLFDNGAWTANKLCTDPADPTGAPVAHIPTRITEWAIDEATGEATIAWNYEVADRYALFAGSALRLSNGNTLIGWASETDATASEVNAAGTLLWELRDPTATWFTYRAALAPVPDATPPTVAFTSGLEGSTFLQDAVVKVDYTCSDRGGSGLRTCTAPVASGAALDTRTAGARTLTVRATDGDGNVTTKTLHYTVTAAYRPDAQVRKVSGGAWLGVDSYTTTRMTMPISLSWSTKAGSAYVRIVNDGKRTDTMTVRGTPSGGGFAVSYWYGDRNVTAAVTAGTYRTAALAPGASALLKVRVAVASTTVRVGSAREVWVVTGSLARPAVRDSVVVKAAAVR
ncbi:aryl-sulfate sulfotransferase [Longivirga aurantiaca]|uniref:Aryl-sulfate sulfotransferase n=1 Tax=Longivirga aurantiaca TaxID=1837743 RepID=A0ABW1T1M1_9ACTN